MPDPFEALHTPVIPVHPDPAFAERLRARVQRALYLPKGVTVSDLAQTSPTQRAAPSAVEGIRHGDIGYVSLWVPDVEQAAAFYTAVLGWSYRPGEAGPNRLVAGAGVDHGLAGGYEHPTLFLCFAVDDIAAALERVRDGGGQTQEPTAQPYGLIASCVDDDGTAFAVYQPPAGEREPRPPRNGVRNGDLSYVTMEVRDSARARAFYGSVLGWRFTPGRVADGWGPDDVSPMTGMHGGHDVATVVPMYRVDDIRAAVATVRASGGTATDPEQQPYGLTSECVDDQGTRFYLGQH